MNKNSLYNDVRFIKENIRLIIPEILPINNNVRLRFEQIGDKLNFILSEYTANKNNHSDSIKPHEYRNIAISQLMPSIFKD